MICVGVVGPQLGEQVHVSGETNPVADASRDVDLASTLNARDIVVATAWQARDLAPLLRLAIQPVCERSVAVDHERPRVRKWLHERRDRVVRVECRRVQKAA